MTPTEQRVQRLEDKLRADDYQPLVVEVDPTIGDEDYVEARRPSGTFLDSRGRPVIKLVAGRMGICDALERRPTRTAGKSGDAAASRCRRREDIRELDVARGTIWVLRHAAKPDASAELILVQNVMMWRAIGAAQNPAGAVACAVPRRVGERRLLGLDHEREQPARSAAKRAVAAGIRAELMTRKEQRKSRLRYFQAAELDATGRMPLARARPAGSHILRAVTARNRAPNLFGAVSDRARLRLRSAWCPANPSRARQSSKSAMTTTCFAPRAGHHDAARLAGHCRRHPIPEMDRLCFGT
jgi:hypothetical protein